MVCNWKLICRHSQTLGSGYFTLAAAFEFLITAYHLEPGLLNAVASSNGDLMTKKVNMHHKLAFPYCKLLHVYILQYMHLYPPAAS